ncbi:uncharacterized protein LOC143920733 [Arctopsyche grandis]|uniref:uncharacterized protein LOC143920733 n=1 Tax=Arctopsyche grandis TaxID=121162 RepID=UPI00406D94E9
MIKSTLILAVCFFLVVQIEFSSQSLIRKRRQDDGISFPDTDNRFGGGGFWGEQSRPNRPNNNNNINNNNQRPNNNRPNTNDRRTTTTAAPATTTAGGVATPNPDCLRRCLTTPEYNPVCGDNRVDYDNMSRLNCARQCGLSNLGLLRNGRCPRQ